MANPVSNSMNINSLKSNKSDPTQPPPCFTLIVKLSFFKLIPHLSFLLCYSSLTLSTKLTRIPTLLTEKYVNDVKKTDNSGKIR